MIKIDHVTYRYDEEHTALKDISLEINKGEMLAITEAARVPSQSISMRCCCPRRGASR